jgi:hypothetical protein
LVKSQWNLFDSFYSSKEVYTVFLTLPLPDPGEDDTSVTFAPFYIDWNEPFKTLNDIGFIHGMEQADPEGLRHHVTLKTTDNNVWRAWRESNPRPAA